MFRFLSLTSPLFCLKALCLLPDANLGDVTARVLALEMMLAIKASPRPDEVGGEKDRADLAALRSVTS